MTNLLEIFDVVDEQDCVVGQATRGEVHAKDMLHRAVHILIFNLQGEFFLQKRSLTKDRFPGCWDSSCSGHVDTGEDYLTAAHRELREELGLDLSAMQLDLQPIVKLTPAPDTGFEFIQIYLLGPYAGTFQLNAEEITEGKFITIDKLKQSLQKEPEIYAGAMNALWLTHADLLEHFLQGRTNSH